MVNNSVAHMYIDHFLQAALLSRLSEAGGPLRFSDAKEDGIENSLFMYHANKLIARHIITKDSEGFRLTANGARWINFIGRDMLYPQPAVKLLIQFVIRDKDGNILLSVRKGQLKELLNDYMLPGGLHKSGATANENAQRIATNFFGQQARPRFLTEVESINTYSDGFIYHSLSHIYAVDVEVGITPPEDDRFDFEWLALQDVHTANSLFAKSLFVPLFIEKVQNNTLQTREFITVDYA